MATVNILNPKIITFEFRQDKTDKDYGSCMWARFNLDSINYSMFIESDCGDYAHCWVPTPQTESFLKLCSHFNTEYLLGKLSEECVVDGQKTWENLEEIIKDALEDLTEKPYFDIKEIRDSCYSRCTAIEVYDAIESAVESNGLSGIIESYDIIESIVTDYPASAKKIVEIYMTYIVPAINKILEETVCGEDNVYTL